MLFSVLQLRSFHSGTIISLISIAVMWALVAGQRRVGHAHKRLDEAVFAAYGWKSDLSDEEILEKLLSLGSLRFASPPAHPSGTAALRRPRGALRRECYANLERSKADT